MYLKFIGYQPPIEEYSKDEVSSLLSILRFEYYFIDYRFLIYFIFLERKCITRISNTFNESKST